MIQFYPGSGRIENARKGVEVASIADVLSQEPVFGAPEKVGLDGGPEAAGTSDQGVVVGDQLFGRATGRDKAARVGWNRNRFPRFGLDFGDHHALTESPRGAQSSCERVEAPWGAGGVEVRAHAARANEGDAGIEVDADDVGGTQGGGDRIALVACLPPL